MQYFVAQVVAAAAWDTGYSWLRNSISDLGITTCGQFRGHYVCSPLSAVFNYSIIAVGAVMLLGSLLVSYQVRGTSTSLAGLACIAAAGVGSILVGAFPANTIKLVHDLGTGLAFVGGTAGVLALAFALRELPRSLRYYTASSGLVPLAGLILLALYFFAGIGFKGLDERLISYPLVLWLTVVGGYLSIRSVRQRLRRSAP